MTQRVLLATLTLLIAAIGSINTQMPLDHLQPHNQPNFRQRPSLARARRMYALCPPQFSKIGNECYFLSSKKESWLDAHFECKDRNSKLAEPLKFADRRLRKYLKNRDPSKDNRWIGGMFNWQQEKWQWGYNGGEMKYQAFENQDSSDLRFHCTTMDPKIDYKWSASPCTERHNFICQHRMSYVNEKNRQKVYSKWNETYPNQLASEVEVYVSTSGNSNRSFVKNVPKKNRQSANRKLSSQIPPTEQPDNAPDYLPYSAYSNLEQMQQKTHEDVIHPLHASDSRQATMKPRKRHSKLKLTGEVNLGDQFKHVRKPRPSERRKKVEPPRVNAIEEEEIVTSTTQQLPNEIESGNEVTERATEAPETSTAFVIGKKEASEMQRKLDEKAMRRERLKAKLAQLTPEERQAFLLMKQQRAEAKKKGLM